MSATDIQDALARRFSNFEYILNNKFIFQDWESDFFAISTSGYAYEVEIKISKSDFKADFEKERKHKILACKDAALTMSPSRQTFTMYDSALKMQLECCHIMSIDMTTALIPNRFYYACPAGLISQDEAPHYAGLIHCAGGYANIIKEAPFIHKRKMVLTSTLLDKFYWNYKNLKAQYDILKRKHERSTQNANAVVNPTVIR